MRQANLIWSPVATGGSHPNYQILQGKVVAGRRMVNGGADPSPDCGRGRDHGVAPEATAATPDKMKRSMSGAGSPYRCLSRHPRPTAPYIPLRRRS
jgi:hypothetical protein